MSSGNFEILPSSVICSSDRIVKQVYFANTLTVEACLNAGDHSSIALFSRVS